jgi:hypothetical protein
MALNDTNRVVYAAAGQLKNPSTITVREPCLGAGRIPESVMITRQEREECSISLFDKQGNTSGQFLLGGFCSHSVSFIATLLSKVPFIADVRRV